MAKHTPNATDPVLEVAGNLGSVALTLEGVAEALRSLLQRGKDQPLTHGEQCLLGILYERLDDEAATLGDLEETLRDAARGATT